MSNVTDILVGVDKLLSAHGFSEMASARHQLSIAISLHKQQLTAARQEAAREILEHLRSATFWVDGPDTDVVRIEFIVEYINNTFKLEGGVSDESNSND